MRTSDGTAIDGESVADDQSLIAPENGTDIEGAAAGQEAEGARRRTSNAGTHSQIAQRRVPDVRRILGISVPVTIVLAERCMPLRTVLQITSGTIIEFEAPSDSDLILQVADRTIGKGQAVKVGESFGIRVTSIESVPRRIGALGGR